MKSTTLALGGGLAALMFLATPWIGSTAAVDKTPDIETVVASSITSLQSQSKLTVLNAKMVSYATSRVHRFGMTAEQTDIASADARYSVNLQKLTANDIRYRNGGLQVKLPPIETEMSMPFNKNSFERSTVYTNNSMLFQFGNTEQMLHDNNVGRIMFDLRKQSESKQTEAEVAAIKAIEPIFRLTLEAAGIKNVKVEVSFTAK